MFQHLIELELERSVLRTALALLSKAGHEVFDILARFEFGNQILLGADSVRNFEQLSPDCLV